MENKYMDAVPYFVQHPQEYLWQVYVPIMIWLVIVLGFLILMFKKFTFGNWTDEVKNPYEGETFSMPRGAFRGILTFSLLYVTIILELVNVRIIGFEEEIKEFMVAFQMMIAFYFGSKVMHHVTSADRSKAEAVAEVQKTSGGAQGEFNEDGAAG